MSIQLGGLSSGLPTEEIIAKLIQAERRPVDLLIQRKTDLSLRDSQYKAVRDRVNTLAGTLKTLTATSVVDKNLFKTKSVTSTDNTIATATAKETASPQTISLEVKKLATATKAQSVGSVGQLVTGATNVSDVAQGTVTAGNFTIFVNGVASTIAVDPVNDTVGDVLTQISGVAGITGAAVVGGKIQITFAGGTTVKLGASADTSNFLDATFLKTGVATGTDITSSVVLSSIDTSAAVDTAAANLQTAVTAGSQFTIGTATFDTTGKSLSALISEINNDADAGVTASYNRATNKLELVAKKPGSALITLQDVSGNFLEAMGLISAGDTTASQTAGQNAEFVLNGATLYSASNSVNETITGLTGITLELKKEAVGSPVTLTVGNDNSGLKEKLRELITNFNAVVSFIDEQTNPENDKAVLKRESGVRRLRSQLRSIASSAVAGLTDYNSLMMVGISTGAVTGTGGGTVNTKLQLDEARLDAALADDPDQVESLMRGAGGILTQLRTFVDNALLDDPDPGKDGLFAAASNAIASQIKTLNDSIDRGEDRLLKREEFLRRQFTTMEQLIAQSQSQGNALTNLTNQLLANSKSR